VLDLLRRYQPTSEDDLFDVLVRVVHGSATCMVTTMAVAVWHGYYCM
jgi:hypothetical protein